MAEAILLGPRAKHDLIEQASYLAGNDMAVADRFLDAAAAAFARLADFPEIGSPRETRNARLSGVRVWPIPGFPRQRIFYRRSGSGLEIIRILDVGRDLDAILD